MSHRRVKALDYDEDDYDDYNDYDDHDNGGGELSVQDQEQLRSGTIRVREILGPEYHIPETEIQDALWNYYYDVGKSATFLRNKHKPKQTPKIKGTPSKSSDALKVPIGFFQDCPWGQIPIRRQALIVEEKTYSRGLLGGSSGKMSKLAALAAKRRQKECELPEQTDPTDHAVALGKLTIQPKKHQEVELPTTKQNTNLKSDLAETPVSKVKSKPAMPTADMASLTVQEPQAKFKNINVVAAYKCTKEKNTANFVVIGHIDAGKSTLMGRLLFDLKAVDQRTLEKYQREADSIGKGSFAFAWILDSGSEERERGVTIDIATNKFETEKTNFTILDAPGHQDFVPNMIAGTSQADFAVLVVDASGNNFEAGLRGQTKEHALLARSIGVSRMIIAVNKMDMIEWSQSRFDGIQQELSSFLITTGFQKKNLAFVPCSGLEGSNILKKVHDPKATWYKGNTLVDELDLSEPVTHALEKPLRMTIADVYRGSVQNPLSISGRLEAGTVQIGEQIIVMPSGEQAYVNRLEVDDEPRDWAVAGQNVALHLTDIDAIHLKIGDIVCSPASPVKNLSRFTAKLLTFASLTPQLVDIHRGRLHVPGRISQLLATLDKSSGTEIKKKPKVTQAGAIVRATIETDAPVPLEDGTRIILRAGGETIAAGLLDGA